MVSAIILAAGLSSRMGDNNKLLLPVMGEPLVRRVASAICTAAPGEVITVLGYESAAVQSALEDLPMKFVVNENYPSGMTSSIITGVSKATGNGYMICLSDMYAITAEEYRQILDVYEERRLVNRWCICIPRHYGVPGNPVIFSEAYRQLIINHNQPDGCRDIVKEHAANVEWIDMPTPHITQDIDFPEDYTSLL